MKKANDFIFGTQYYRAPTPEEQCWEPDFKKMSSLGMNMVKFWAQWRWSHRSEEKFYFDDLDRLMDLAAANNMKVTINVIFDVAPIWLYTNFPDAKQITASGHVVEPYAVGHRQIGGNPGPCYNHPGALIERKKFLSAVLEHFKNHPAMSMWDVWNEPEQCYPSRTPDLKTLVCYCPNCVTGFKKWTEMKYGKIQELNNVWGRCYAGFNEVEAPLVPGTLTDFIDWREFHLDTMSLEAEWRLKMAKKTDPEHLSYLHVVPNIYFFNSVTCVDDFSVSGNCDVFASTMNADPHAIVQTVSAAGGKTAYNVESHINHGGFGMHQRILSKQDLLSDWLPQIGLGIRGFLFWQFRPEILGLESPAWGVVNLDGSDRPITDAVADFWKKVKPHAGRILDCPAPESEIAIWKSRKNEIAHFAMDKKLDFISRSVRGYVDALYWQSYSFRFISERMLEERKLDGIKLLIMPSPLYLSRAEADSLNEWVRSGGVLLTEAHLSCYSGTEGRYCRTVPGAGLADSWGICEAQSTSTYHLKIDKNDYSLDGLSPDQVKAIKSSGGLEGGEFLPLSWDGKILFGSSRYAELSGEGIEVMSEHFKGRPVICRKKIGKGTVVYCGTCLGAAAGKSPEVFYDFLRSIADKAGVRPSAVITKEKSGFDSVHVDLMKDRKGSLRYILINNRSDSSSEIEIPVETSEMSGIFSRKTLRSTGNGKFAIPAKFIDVIEI